ncbi:DUF1631 domain-containing protein [Lysobacter sp. D1-1-M9]|uniref:DUF1631 domain-containing protein n=1 Tax=Novilysobacter longmucuonensis TaxID=3098603 RepID=UPI002FC75756
MPTATLASAVLPRRVHVALEHVHALVSEELERQLDGMFTEFEQQLFRRAEQASDPALQAGQFETLRKVRQRRAELAPAFLRFLEASLAQIRAPAGPAGAPAAGGEKLKVDFSRLRLLEDDEVSEGSLVRSIGMRHESRAGLPLMLLGQRFGVLAGAPAFDAERLPLGPHALARALLHACEVLEIDLDVRLVLLHCFDQHVMGNYTQLVETINALLARENILPGLSYVPLRTRASPQSGTRKAAPGSGEARDTARLETPDAAGSRPHTGWLGEAGTGASEGENLAFSLLQELLSGRRDLLGKLRGRPAPQPGARELATGEVVDALQSQQADRSGPPRGPQTVAEVRQTLLAQSRQQHGKPMRLSSGDQDTFELLEMLYAEMRRDLRDGAPGTALAERLQVPVLRAALQDPGFFVRSQHPARQMLNAVAEAGAKWLGEDETDPQLESQLHRAVDHVVENYHGDAAVFESANQSLQEHLQLLARKAEVSERRHVEAVRGKEKLELAKRRAAETIEQAMEGQALPKFARALLQQVWSDVLTLVLLRHGEDSEQWRQHVAATAQIVTASAGAAPAPAGLDQRIEHALALVGYHAGEASAIARRLTTGQDEHDDDPASRTELAMKLKARTRLGADAAATEVARPPRSAQEQACYERLRRVPFGTWIEFTRNQQGEVVRRRMAWYSRVTDRALFVNQRGQRVDEQSLDNVARTMARSQARIVMAEEGRPVDRAWHSALNALRGFIGRGGPRREGRGRDAQAEEPSP